MESTRRCARAVFVPFTRGFPGAPDRKDRAPSPRRVSRTRTIRSGSLNVPIDIPFNIRGSSPFARRLKRRKRLQSIERGQVNIYEISGPDVSGRLHYPEYATPEPRLLLFHNHGALQSVPKAINKCAGCSKASELDNRGASDPQARPEREIRET